MHIYRLLTLSLLTSVCAAQVPVQSPPDKNLVSPAPEAKPPYPPSEFNLQSPGLTPKALSSVRVLQFQPPVRLAGPGVAQNNTCYSIQAYRFTRDNPQSDSVRFTGQSTCAPASQFQLKDADSKIGIAPH